MLSTQAENHLDLVAKAIDCSIPYGQSAYEENEFATAREALSHRARLGIHRGFIDDQGGDLWSPFHGGERVESICRGEEGQGSIFPVFALHCAQLFDREIPERLAERMKRNPHAIYRLICSSLGGWRWESHIRMGMEFFNEYAKGRNIVLFLRVSEIPSVSLLIEVARQNPQIRFVLTEYNIGGQALVHTAMGEADNILIDTMLQYGDQQVELFVERYGAKRMLFTLGYRSLGGAALGAVLSANISRSDKEDILFRNIERLCSLPRFDPSTRPPLKENEWSFFLREGRLPYPIIDSHGHFGPFSQRMLYSQSKEVQIPAKLRHMSRRDIRYFFVSGQSAIKADPLEGNALIERKFLEYGDPRLMAYFAYNPRYAQALNPYLKRIPYSKIFVGFKLLCSYWKVQVTDPRFDAMWSVADRFGLPVLIHTWKDSYNSPNMLDGIAERYPGAKLLLAHCGGNSVGMEEAVGMARKHPNVYLEWCGSFYARQPWEETLKRIGAQKLIFGTDALAHNHEWELARLLSQPFDSGDFRKILHDNMMGLIFPLLEKKNLDRIFES